MELVTNLHETVVYSSRVFVHIITSTFHVTLGAHCLRKLLSVCLVVRCGELILVKSDFD